MADLVNAKLADLVNTGLEDLLASLGRHADGHDGQSDGYRNPRDPQRSHYAPRTCRPSRIRTSYLRWTQHPFARLGRRLVVALDVPVPDELRGAARGDVTRLVQPEWILVPALHGPSRHSLNIGVCRSSAQIADPAQDCTVRWGQGTGTQAAPAGRRSHQRIRPGRPANYGHGGSSARTAPRNHEHGRDRHRVQRDQRCDDTLPPGARALTVFAFSFNPTFG